MKKEKPIAPSTRETRTLAKANAGKEKDEDPVPSNLPNGSGQGHSRKCKSKVVDIEKGPPKKECMPSAIVDAILGRAQNIVQSVEELRRKTDEDTQACARITRIVQYPSTRKLCQQLHR